MNKLAIMAAWALIGALAASFLMLGGLAIVRDGQATTDALNTIDSTMKLFAGFLGGMGIVNTAGQFFGRQQSPAGQAVAGSVAAAAATPPDASASADQGPSNG